MFGHTIRYISQYTAFVKYVKENKVLHYEINDTISNFNLKLAKTYCEY